MDQNLRASALLDYLRAWEPSREDLSLAAEHEELMVALFERGVIEENDALLTQAWLQHLTTLEYKFPDANMSLFESWSAEKFLGGMAVLVDEHTEGDIRYILPVLNAQLPMFATKKYLVMLFYIDVGGSWMDRSMKRDLRSLAPGLRLEL